jgi:hypothetical protein
VTGPRAIAIVSEGICPAGHGDLTLVPVRRPDGGQPQAGWCGPCRRGYAVCRHRHDEDCAGPNLDEADLWCPYNEGDEVITWHEPAGLLLYEVPGGLS